MPNLILQDLGTPGQLLGMLPMVLIFAIFYFVLFLPMQRQRKTQARMLEALKSGDTVVTTGGIVGTIHSMASDDTLVIKVKPDNLKLQIARNAVASLIAEEPRK